MIKRILAFVCGLFLMAMGVAFSIVSLLGTTPISSISYSLALITNIDIGITTFLFNASLWMCGLFLVISIFLTAFGIFVYMPANIAPLPGEGCVEAIAITTGWRFSSIKIAFDATMVVLSLVMCGLFYTNILGAVNIGTFISAFFVGFTLRQINNLYEYLTGNKVNVVNNQ